MLHESEQDSSNIEFDLEAFLRDEVNARSADDEEKQLRDLAMQYRKRSRSERGKLSQAPGIFLDQDPLAYELGERNSATAHLFGRMSSELVLGNKLWMVPAPVRFTGHTIFSLNNEF